ncbi:CHC2 zinc finger domain-containing protein [Comamonas thiooxydans]|uniref:CHC2 zinc finger domain-containing protein n=1 Tax=Comamonas thiooxydans TaxID=363952 RepID=UPI0009B860C9|nr:CHC2 zinc finger domain-containing protein [Comamonas thiooxydans]
MNAITHYLSGHLTRLTDRRGSNFATACCPFHDEKNPSFSVNKVSGSFVCFACGEKGGFAELIAKIEAISLGEAIKKAVYLRKN